MNPRHRNLMRNVLGMILQSNLRTKELEELVQALRSGQFSDELAFLLDRQLDHFREYGPNSSADNYTSIAEEIMKRNRISKDSLINIIASIDSTYAKSLSRSKTIRDIIEDFLTISNQTKADKLISTLDAAGTSDAYLKGISDTRR